MSCRTNHGAVSLDAITRSTAWDVYEEPPEKCGRFNIRQLQGKRETSLLASRLIPSVPQDRPRPQIWMGSIVTFKESAVDEFKDKPWIY